jgi:hypothetical protein
MPMTKRWKMFLRRSNSLQSGALPLGLLTRTELPAAGAACIQKTPTSLVSVDCTHVRTRRDIYIHMQDQGSPRQCVSLEIRIYNRYKSWDHSIYQSTNCKSPNLVILGADTYQVCIVDVTGKRVSGCSIHSSSKGEYVQNHL